MIGILLSEITGAAIAAGVENTEALPTLSRPRDFCQLTRKKKSIASDIDGSSAPFYGLIGIDALPTETHSGVSSNTPAAAPLTTALVLNGARAGSAQQLEFREDEV